MQTEPKVLEGWSKPEALKGSLRSHGGLSSLSDGCRQQEGLAVGEEEISAEAHSSAGAHRAGGRPYSMPFQTLTSPDDATSRLSAASTIGPLWNDTQSSPDPEGGTR